MRINKITIGISACLLLFAAGFLSSCKEHSMETEVIQVTADTSVVTKLGITIRPITDSLARIIADTASTGTALTSSLETEHNIVFFDVKEQVGVLVIDVKVRTSDGAIITISGDDDGDRHH